MLEIEENAFEREVLAASAEIPVLVDFWAPWCGPCRALGPLLERLEESYGGRFKLVKVNSDASPELSARYGVRSIPYVIAFIGGQPVDSFVGALPEGQVRVFLDHVLPGPAEFERLKALRLAGEGRLDEAATALRAAIALDPTHGRARLDLAELLIERMPSPVDPARLSEAETELAAARSNARNEPRWRALDTRVASLRTAASLPPGEALRKRVAEDPSDADARLKLAQHYIAQRQLEPALEELLEIVARDRKVGDGTARSMMLSIFELLADQPQLVSDYRRRLSAVLNR
jgi:putative thioredoxin